RLEREFDLDLLVTAPNVAYRVKEKDGDWIEVHNPAEFPREVEEVEEPYVAASIIVPKEHVGAVMELNNERRGTFGRLEYLAPDVRHPDPGGHRLTRHRAGDGEGEAEGRAREVLRRRHHPQAEAAREAEGRQEADEAGRRSRGAAGGVPRRAQHRAGRRREAL